MVSDSLRGRLLGSLRLYFRPASLSLLHMLTRWLPSLTLPSWLSHSFLPVCQHRRASSHRDEGHVSPSSGTCTSLFSQSREPMTTSLPVTWAFILALCSPLRSGTSWRFLPLTHIHSFLGSAQAQNSVPGGLSSASVYSVI